MIEKNTQESVKKLSDLVESPEPMDKVQTRSDGSPNTQVSGDQSDDGGSSLSSEEDVVTVEITDLTEALYKELLESNDPKLVVLANSTKQFISVNLNELTTEQVLATSAASYGITLKNVLENNIYDSFKAQWEFLIKIVKNHRNDVFNPININKGIRKWNSTQQRNTQYRYIMDILYVLTTPNLNKSDRLKRININEVFGSGPSFNSNAKNNFIRYYDIRRK